MAQKRRSFVAVFPAGSSGREDLRPPAAKVMKLPWKPPGRFPLFFDILFNVVVNNEHRADNNYHRDTHKYRRARQFLVIKRRERIIHEMLQHIERIIRIISGQQVNLAEYLERVDDAHQRDEQNTRREIPELNPGEYLPA